MGNPAIDSLAQGDGSIALTGNKGDGKSTAVAYFRRENHQNILVLHYNPIHWPCGERPKVPDENHVSQIMALAATDIASLLESPPIMAAAASLNPLQREFLCWLIEKYLGRRTLIRLTYRLQNEAHVALAPPEQFEDLYPSTSLAADIWGQIGELGELAQALGFSQIALSLDLSDYEISTHLQDLVDLLTHLDLLEHPNWIIRATLPNMDIIRNQILNQTNGRLYSLRLEHDESRQGDIVKKHLNLATDGRVTQFTDLAETAVLDRAFEEINTLYGLNALAGQLNWAETLLYTHENGCQVEDEKLTAVDAKVITFYKRHILLRLDKEKQGVWRGPQFISLENQPFELMKKLFELRGQPAPEALYDVAGSVANLNTLANRIRNKIEPVKGKTNVFLQNRRDQGYWLENAIL